MYSLGKIKKQVPREALMMLCSNKSELFTSYLHARLKHDKEFKEDIEARTWFEWTPEMLKGLPDEAIEKICRFKMGDRYDKYD